MMPGGQPAHLYILSWLKQDNDFANMQSAGLFGTARKHRRCLRSHHCSAPRILLTLLDHVHRSRRSTEGVDSCLCLLALFNHSTCPPRSVEKREDTLTGSTDLHGCAPATAPRHVGRRHFQMRLVSDPRPTRASPSPGQAKLLAGELAETSTWAEGGDTNKHIEHVPSFTLVPCFRLKISKLFCGCFFFLGGFPITSR